MKIYELVVEKLDGVKDEFSFESHKNAMAKYKEVLNGDTDNIHIIEFNKNENGSVSNMFTKKVNKKQIWKECREVAKDMHDLVTYVERLKIHHEATIKISERKRETLLHLIGAMSQKVYADKNEEVKLKLQLFDELAYYEDERRIAKTELNDILHMQQSTQNLNIENLLKEKTEYRIYKENIATTRNKYERIVTYKDDNERDKFIKQNKNYAYYILDEMTNTIYFYNRFDGGWSLKNMKKNQNSNNVVKLAVKNVTPNNEVSKKEDVKNETEETRSFRFRTIKEKGHYMSNFKNKYKYMEIDDAKQMIYFSNHPIDLDMIV